MLNALSLLYTKGSKPVVCETKTENIEPLFRGTHYAVSTPENAVTLTNVGTQMYSQIFIVPHPVHAH